VITELGNKDYYVVGLLASGKTDIGSKIKKVKQKERKYNILTYNKSLLYRKTPITLFFE
jgi:hypothetical protein